MDAIVIDFLVDVGDTSRKKVPRSIYIIHLTEVAGTHETRLPTCAFSHLYYAPPGEIAKTRADHKSPVMAVVHTYRDGLRK